MMLFSYYLLAGLVSIPLAVNSESSASTSAVLDLIPDNIDNITLNGKPAFVEFFAPWCGHCKNLAPVWEQLSQDFAFAKDKISIAKVDADAEKSLGKRFGIQGFPTIKYFDGTSKTPEDYQGGLDLESLSEFVSKKTGVQPKKARTSQSLVVTLNDASFSTQVNGEKNVIVAFTASWCGHCKKLAPHWENVARDFALETDVVIAKVDAEAESSKDTAKAQSITSYPTIKFFPKGSTEAERYKGAPTEEEIVAFLNKKSGTHRVAGGGLDASAGTVDSLEPLVSKFTAGSNLAEITTEAMKALNDLSEDTRSWNAEYYIKIFQKLKDSNEYATKELARLSKILSNGGLTPIKIDEFTIKTNILKRFTKKDTSKSEL